jgi:hypothetical protein
MKKVIFQIICLAVFLGSCQNEISIEPTKISQLPEVNVAAKDTGVQLRSAGTTVSETVYGVSLDNAQNSRIVRIGLSGVSPAYTANYTPPIPIKMSTGAVVTNATGITFNPINRTFLVTTGPNSNVPNSLLQVDIVTGKVLTSVKTTLKNSAISLKDIEHSQTPSNCGLPSSPIFPSRFWAISNRNIVEVDPRTGVCTVWATVPGTGILHGLAADDSDQVWVTQTNLTSPIAQIWRYAIQCVPSKGLVLANIGSISNRTGTGFGAEGGLMYTRSANFELFYATKSATFFTSDFSPTVIPSMWSGAPNAKSIITNNPTGVEDITHVRIP